MAKRKTPGMIDVLKREIRNTGQSMYAVSQGAGVPYPIVNRLMNGRRGVSVANLDKLCTYLGLELVKAKRPQKN